MPDTRYKSYLLTLLTIILAFNHVDRIALGIVLQDIKLELALTDTQLGLLTGIAFALFYSIMGIPLARWADRGNRITIITVTTALWSAAVALCAAAGSFAQLVFIRVWVAIGEAGCVPPAHSLIADHFSRAQRPRAVARYMLGGPLALTFGYFAAGWLNELYGWRVTFIVLGLPGLALAALVWSTLSEPRQVERKYRAASVTEIASQPRFLTVCATLWANVAFRHLLFCFSVWYFFGYGLLQWQPAFFMRSHGIQSGELGTWFAAIYGFGGCLGVYLGGELATRYAANNERLQLLACAVAFGFFAALNLSAYLASNVYAAFACLGLAALGGNMAQGPILASLQSLVQPGMRAMSIALVYLFANLIGLGLGPLAAGALSDGLRPMLEHESLRYALAILCPGYLWASWHLWRASRTVSSDMHTANGEALKAAPGSEKLLDRGGCRG